MPSVEIFTDGGCDPNPGPGGYAAILVHPKKRIEISGAYRLTTNNRMEILAAVQAIELLKRPCSVILHSDSKYLVDAMSQGWAVKWRSKGWWRTRSARPANVDLWKRLLAAAEKHRVKFCWLRGHNGHRENERCDQLCALARKSSPLPADEGYEESLKSPSAWDDASETGSRLL